MWFLILANFQIRSSQTESIAWSKFLGFFPSILLNRTRCENPVVESMERTNKLMWNRTENEGKNRAKAKAGARIREKLKLAKPTAYKSWYLRSLKNFCSLFYSFFWELSCETVSVQALFIQVMCMHRCLEQNQLLNGYCFMLANI